MSIQPFSAVLLDIEGTTTPISFVYDTLFPYARDHVERFLAERWHDDAVQEVVDVLRKQARQDIADGMEGAVPIPKGQGAGVRVTVLASVRWLMDNDRKVTGLKALQGHIWRAGYEDGTLESVLFPDVPAALERWHDHEIPVAIYSSGSIAAQKLLFRYSEAGDFTPLLRDYFDTTTGSKKEASSYGAIASSLGLEPAELLFLTDVVAEAEAAREAGVQAAIMNRPGNRPQPEHDFVVLDDFSSL